MKARMITPPPSPFFYASTRLGGIHRGLFVEGGRKWGLRYLPSSFTPSFISGCRRSYALHRKIAKGVCVPFPFPSQSSFQPSLPYLLSSFIGHTSEQCTFRRISAFTFASVPVGLLHHCKEIRNRNYMRSTAYRNSQAVHINGRRGRENGQRKRRNFFPALIASLVCLVLINSGQSWIMCSPSSSNPLLLSM